VHQVGFYYIEEPSNYWFLGRSTL